ncbi:large proline-rich protein BAG6-like [Homalodisca vitripennis]|uniref:large proline-rich protein BAG6-like n=1 Tax=Homalodisca vitripennis TaxID=197043 RepID=UPI001EEA0E98|nr:large proline-rich protein BAG6-like [Homalodisca vitripennis]
MQNPRHCLSQSRLAVVRSMLRRASIILNRLENPPQESADTSPENGTCPPETSAEEETAAGATTPIAAIEISPQLIINGQQIDVGGPSIDIQAEAVPEQTTSASGGNGDPQTASTSEEQPPQNETEEEGGNAGSRYPRTRGLADLMDQASEINTRVQPFMAQYQQLMRDDPVFSDQEAVVTNQRLFTSVSEIMHNLAHAYHALSDIMCDLAQPPPRFLRCRPVLIHHSAVVQTGFPIQVSASLATGSNNGQSSNSGGTRATDGGARATAGPSEQPEPQGPVTGAAEATAQPVTGPTAAANPPTITRTPGEDASGQTQTPSSQRTTRIGQTRVLI